MSNYPFAQEQLANMNKDTHMRCPECKGKGGRYVEDKKWRYASSGDYVRKWDECERCSGNCIIPKPEAAHA